MPECNQKTPLCQCIDWKTGDLAVGVNHLMNHFEFQRFELEYSTLEPEENRRLCKGPPAQGQQQNNRSEHCKRAATDISSVAALLYLKYDI